MVRPGAALGNRPGRELDVPGESGQRFATLLDAARRRAGLSGRDLAAQAGVSQAAVSRAERGHDVSWSTLHALCLALPELDAAEILGRPRGAARPASKRLWQFYADTYGFQARQVTYEVVVDASGGQRTELAVTGVRATRGSLRDAVLRTAILGAVFDGSPGAFIQLEPSAADLEGGTRRLEDEELLHEYELPRDLDRRGLSYRRTDTGEPRDAAHVLAREAPYGCPFPLGTAFWLDYPTRRFVLRVRFEGDERPAAVRVEAWPGSLGVDPTQPMNRWADLHPHAPRWLATDRRGVVELRIDLPLPGPCYGLSWGHERPPPGEPSPARVGEDAPPPIGSVLRRARAREGLTCRELARRVSVSAATIVESEHGREPRLSTLAACLEVLPDLRPHEVLPAADPPGPVTDTEAWRYQRALFGMESDLEDRHCTLTPSGILRGRFRTDGLTWTPAAAQDLRVRYGIGRLLEAHDWELESISAETRGSAEEPRVRLLAGGPGQPVHELRFHAEGAHPLVSYERRAVIKNQYAMRAARADEPPFASSAQWRARRAGPPDDAGAPHGPIAEAIYLETNTPARRLRLEVCFPRGYRLIEPQVKVHPRPSFPAETLEDLGPLVHADGLRFEVDPAGSRICLSVDHPLVGFSYAVSWQLP